MAKITRIKAGESSDRRDLDAEPAITRKKVVVKDKKTDKTKQKRIRKAEKSISNSKTDGKKPFVLICPFVYLGSYLRDSWQELRQVRWPNAKATWKMVLAVFVYTALFVIIILVLDLFFTWLFNLILGKG